MSADLVSGDAATFERQCLGKERHASEAAARAAHQFRVQQKVVRSGDGARAYRCRFCQGWHIGHWRFRIPT
jgi:hypothetical protein